MSGEEKQTAERASAQDADDLEVPADAADEIKGGDNQPPPNFKRAGVTYNLTNELKDPVRQK